MEELVSAALMRVEFILVAIDTAKDIFTNAMISTLAALCLTPNTRYILTQILWLYNHKIEDFDYMRSFINFKYFVHGMIHLKLHSFINIIMKISKFLNDCDNSSWKLNKRRLSVNFGFWASRLCRSWSLDFVDVDRLSPRSSSSRRRAGGHHGRRVGRKSGWKSLARPEKQLDHSGVNLLVVLVSNVELGVSWHVNDVILKML